MMDRRGVAMGLMGLGAVLVVVSTIGWIGQRGAAQPEAAPDSTTTTTVAETTTTSSTTTTTEATTTTTTEATTTTTVATTVVDEAALVEEFIPMYRIAIQLENVDFLFERLHPEVLTLSTPELCRDFIEREILALQEYEQIGPVEGPEVRDLGTGLESVYTVPVSFVFEGTSFEATAAYAVVDGEVRWFTECRAAA